MTAVPTTLTVQGNYAQMTAFVNGLDSFPRLFVIQKFLLAFGAAASGSSSATSEAATASGGATASTGSTTRSAALDGRSDTPPTAGPYNLQITGSIYYTSTPSALGRLFEGPGRPVEPQVEAAAVGVPPPGAPQAQIPLTCMSPMARVWPAAMLGNHSTSAPTATSDSSMRWRVEAHGDLPDRLGELAVPDHQALGAYRKIAADRVDPRVHTGHRLDEEAVTHRGQHAVLVEAFGPGGQREGPATRTRRAGIPAAHRGARRRDTGT